MNRLRADTYATYLAYKDPRTPWYAKVLVGLVVIHTLSSIDLIPDFIPVLGYLDDLLIVPLGVALALKLVPQDVMTECRQKAQEVATADRPTSWVAAAIIVTMWLVGAGLLTWIVVRVFSS